MAKKNGVIYTPEWTVKLILKHVGWSNESLLKYSIIDPSCGTGAFLLCIVEEFLEFCMAFGVEETEIRHALENNLYGWDTDKKAVDEAVIKLNSLTWAYGIKNINWSLSVKDSLLSDTSKEFFDFVVGNPPYIRIQDLDTSYFNSVRNKWSFCSLGSADLYFGFYQLGVSLLNKCGRLGYISPNSFFTSYAAKNMRDSIIKYKYLKLVIDFKDYKVFDGVSTYTAIVVLDKNKASTVQYYVWEDEGEEKYIDNIPYAYLNGGNGSWWFSSVKNLNNIITHRPNSKQLGSIADISVGIATLSDSVYIFDDIKYIGGGFVELNNKLRSCTVEKESVCDILKVSTGEIKYIIFPYECVCNKQVVIPEKTMRTKFPKTYEYFLSVREVLESRAGAHKLCVWYEFGRSQGINLSKDIDIFISGVNKEPNFYSIPTISGLFYSGYGVKLKSNYEHISREFFLNQLNSDRMKQFIDITSKPFNSGYKSYAKSFISPFLIDLPSGI